MLKLLPVPIPQKMKLPRGESKEFTVAQLEMDSGC